MRDLGEMWGSGIVGREREREKKELIRTYYLHPMLPSVLYLPT